MKKSFLLIAGAALLFAGCNKVENENQEVVPEKEARTVILKATLADNTRVSADAAGEYSWQQGDVICVSVNGPDGLTSAPFRALSAGSTSNFEGVVIGELGPYAFYPYSWDPGHSVSPIPESDGYDVVFGLGSEYDYKKDVTNMPMMGDITSEGVSFKAVGGLLKVIVYNVPEDAYNFYFTTDKKITGGFNVSGNTDGSKQIEASSDGVEGHNYIWFHLFEYDDNDNIVRFRENNMVFYIPLPVGTYNTFSFGFWGIQNPEDSNGGTPYEIQTKTATITGGLTVHRNEIIITPSINTGSAGTPVDDATLSNEDIVAAHANNSLGNTNSTYTFSNSAGQEWKVGDGSYQGNYGGSQTYYIQLKKGSGWIKLPDFENNISTITVHDVVNANEGKYAGTLHLKNGNDSNAASLATGTASEAYGDIVLTAPANTKTGYLIPDNTSAIKIYAITVSFNGITPPTTPSIYTPKESATISAVSFVANIDGVKIVNPLDNQGIVATTDAEWLTVEFEGGNWTDGRKLKATANAHNYESSERTATITLRATGATKTITIKQSSSLIPNPTLTATEDNASFTITWTGHEKAASYVGYYSSSELSDPTTGTQLDIVADGNAFTATPSEPVTNGTKYYVYIKVGSLIESATAYQIATGWSTAEVTPSAVIDYATTYTSNLTLSSTGGQNAQNVTVVIDGNNYPAVKAATGSTVGKVKVTVPAGATRLHIHAAAWKGEVSDISISGPTVDPNSISLSVNSGIHDSSPFTLEGDASSYYFDLDIHWNSSNPRDIYFTGVKGKRFVIWGVNYE